MAELKNTIVNGVLSVNGDAIASTIIKRGGADTHVLLAGGGTKAISDFATADVGTGYLPLTGGTMTGAITHPENKMALKFRTHASYETGLVYGTSGNEALTIAMQNPVTAFQIVYRTKPSDYGSGTWQSVTPLFQTKDDKVIINRKITQTSDTSSLKLLDVNGEMAATTIYENGTSLANKYLGKTTYEWNKEYAASSNGAVSLGRYYLYDTQLTFDITTTTSTTISGKLVIAAQNGSIKKATVYGDASGTLVSYLTIYQSAITGNRSWVEVFCNFPGWSKNKVHIYAVALDSATVTRQMASVTFTNDVPSGVTSGDTKWTGTIVNDISPDYIKINISGNSGTLTTEQLAALKANPHKTILN